MRNPTIINSRSAGSTGGKGNAFHFEPITSSNVETVAELLQERNDTMRSYTRWKYAQKPDADFKGVIAERDGVPVGCFGLVVRDLVLPDCRRMRCGWFADWYVTTRVRAGGLGTEMLREISKNYPIVFGHPAPEKARKICLANGYRPIGFQSRRRLVFDRFVYERARTRYSVKAVANLLFGVQRSAGVKLAALSAGRRSDGNGHALKPFAHFADVEDHTTWVSRQPVRPDASRRNGLWETIGLQVFFVDDLVPGSGLRRRIQFTKGHRQFSREAWRPFIRACRDAGCVYLECFTTNRLLDGVWASFGAWRHPEASVLVHGQIDLTDKLFLHGWDRENWTYLAGGSSNGEGR